jgi:hypothetical protein
MPLISPAHAHSDLKAFTENFGKITLAHLQPLLACGSSETAIT